MNSSQIIHSRLAAIALGSTFFALTAGFHQAQQPSPRPPASFSSPAPSPAPVKPAADSERRIRERLGAIKMERVAFDQTDFEQVVAYLRSKIRELDRAGVASGITITIRTHPKPTPVTFDRRNISAIEALQSCGDLAGYKMRFDEAGISFIAGPPAPNPADRALLTDLEQNIAEMEAEMADLEQRKSSTAVEERLKAIRIVYSELMARYYRVKYRVTPDTGASGATPAPIAPTKSDIR